MKKALMVVGGVLGVVLVGVLGVASMQPDTYHVERSVTVAAAPTDLFPYANDYTKWALWNPWGQKDPTMKTTSSANPVGVGAWTGWEGNKDVGQGKMTILESVPDQRVKHELHFIEPFDDTATVTFTMKPAGDQTTFIWAMDGNMNLMSKVMCLFSNMDGMIGPDFVTGLATLKPKAEADAKARLAFEASARQAAQEAALATMNVVPDAPMHDGATR